MFLAVAISLLAVKPRAMEDCLIERRKSEIQQRDSGPGARKMGEMVSLPEESSSPPCSSPRNGQGRRPTGNVCNSALPRQMTERATISHCSKNTETQQKI